MAEILISLTIIGIIAAITLPALQANINESAWKAQKKALYSRMSQALSLLPSLNGYGIGETQSITNEQAAKAFVTNGLITVLKINNICESTNLKDCGIPGKFTNMANSKMDFPKNLTELNPMFTSTYVDANNSSYTNPQKNIDTVVVAFETSNGESIAVFYNPLCQPDMGENSSWHYSQPKMCANFIYDLNGKKGPNKVGKDIGFITALYPTDSNIVAPIPLSKNAKINNNSTIKQTEAAAVCRTQDENSRVPNRDEATAMFYNKQLLGIPYNHFWSSSVVSENTAWFQNFNVGRRGVSNRSYEYCVRCVRR